MSKLTKDRSSVFTKIKNFLLPNRIFRRNKRQSHFLIIRIIHTYRFLIAIIIVIMLASYLLIFLQSDQNRINRRELKKSKDICLQSSRSAWCGSTDKCYVISEDFCKDNANNLILDITDKTGVDLIDSGETTFNWNLKTIIGESEQNVKGELYEARALTLSDVNKVQGYLKSISTLDSLNVINGISGGLRGYYYNDLVCSLDFRYQEMRGETNSEMVPVKDSLNLKLRCGTLKLGKK